MKTITKPYFKCDFCGKKQFRKCDMTRHEKWCKKNPLNDHACFHYCKHLIKDKIVSVDAYDGEQFSSLCTFQCAVTKKFMYSSIAERRKLVDRLPKGTERMPLHCNLYEDKDYGINENWD